MGALALEPMRADEYRDSGEVAFWRGLFVAGVLFVLLSNVWRSLDHRYFMWPLVLTLALVAASLLVLPGVRRGGCDVEDTGLTVRSWLRSQRIEYDQLQYVVSTEFDGWGKWWEWASIVLIYRTEAGNERRFRFCGSHSKARAEDAARRLHKALPETARAHVRLVHPPLGYSTLRYLNPG